MVKGGSTQRERDGYRKLQKRKEDETGKKREKEFRMPGSSESHSSTSHTRNRAKSTERGEGCGGGGCLLIWGGLASQNPFPLQHGSTNNFARRGVGISVYPNKLPGVSLP